MQDSEIWAAALRSDLDAAARRERIETLTDRMGLRRNAPERFAHEFSGGQRQRIAIARALAVQPRRVMRAGQIVEQGGYEAEVGRPVYYDTRALMAAVPRVELLARL